MKLSKCCKYPVMVEGHTTNFYFCVKCGKACDVEEYVKKEDLPDENEIIDIIIYSDIAGLALREVVNHKIKASRYDNAINKLAQTIVKRIQGE